MTFQCRTEADLRALCGQHGLRLRPWGGGWRITGAGVDLIVSDPRDLTAADLEPVTWRRGRGSAAGFVP